MTTDRRGGGPFDDDLQSELDAWDATFDAIQSDSPATVTPFAAEAGPPAQVAAAPASPFDLALDDPVDCISSAKHNLARFR